MEKKDIWIFCEYKNKADAKKLKDVIDSQSHKSQIVSIKSFPIAHGMIHFLLKISNQCHLALVLIAEDSRGYWWLSKELKVQQIGGRFKNIYPIFLTKTVVPSWWKDEEQRFLTIDNLQSDLEKIAIS